MFKNHVLITIRILLKEKVYTCINLIGLSIGMGCCLLALIFIHYELSWDQFHTHSDRIFRVLLATPSKNLVVPVTSPVRPFDEHAFSGRAYCKLE